MRTILLILAAWLSVRALRADEQLVKQFDGHYSLTTADFQVPDGWELRWHSDQVLSIGVIRLDNTVAAGATGRNVGSLYLPEGGKYRIRVRGREPIPWDVTVYALNGVPAPPAAGEDGDITFYQPSPGPKYHPAPHVAMAPSPSAVSAPVAPPPPSLPTSLSARQSQSIVTVKGDRASGHGFFLKTKGGTVVMTTIALLANNPHLEIDTLSGTKVTWLQIQGATDRNLAMIQIKDFGYPALEPGEPSAVQAGGTVLTSGEGGRDNEPEPVVSVGAERVEINDLQAPIGTPAILASTGRAIGVVTSVHPSLDLSSFNQSGFADREATRKGAPSLFALRFDNVGGWEPYDWNRFLVQTLFLDDFNQHTRSLDAYLNGEDDGGSRQWQRDDKLKAANTLFVQDTAGGDPAERIDALHALLFELGVAADTDADQIAVPANFYFYERKRAADELAYRKALKAQLDVYGSDVTSLNKVAARNN